MNNTVIAAGMVVKSKPFPRLRGGEPMAEITAAVSSAFSPPMRG